MGQGQGHRTKKHFCESLAFECLDLQIWFSVHTYSFKISRSRSSIKVKVTEAKDHMSIDVVGVLSLIERQCLLILFLVLAWLKQIIS